jgi:AraC-like DNA-binding protein
MQSPVFNIHDLILVLTLAVCLLLVVFQLLLSKQKEIASRLLCLFFVCVGVHALCNLLLWNNHLHIESPLIKWSLSLGLTLSVVGKSISLFLYVVSLTRASFQFGRREAMHLINLAVVFALLIIGHINSDQLRYTAGGQTLFTVYVTSLLWHYLKLITVIYAVSAVWVVWRYKQQLKAFYSSLSMEGPQWLMLLTLGFALNWCWSLVVHLLGQFIGISRADSLGILDNYITFILVNALFIYSLLYAHQLIETKKASKEKLVPASEHSPEFIKRIRDGMDVQQLYLKPTLNIEEFAKQVGIHYREVSVIINQHFDTNFFEFVNSYRVNKAKAMLVDTACADKTILEILLDCGFNSKSSFHRFFKRYTGMSAADYRKQYAAAVSLKSSANE